MLGDLPPSSSASGVKVAAAAAHQPTGRVRSAGEGDLVDPAVADQGVARLRAPDHHVEHPGGSPASRASSAKRSTPNGDSSGGLATTVLPAARAGAAFWPMPIIEPFHGGITATTP